MAGYNERFAQRKDEVEWLYKELYGGNRWYLDQLENTLALFAKDRPLDLRHLDDQREKHPEWYLDSHVLEVKLDVGRFAGNLLSLETKIPYLREMGATSVRIRTIFKKDSRSLVVDFDEVDPRMGTNADVQRVCSRMLANGIDVRLEFPMEATSVSHGWAVLACQGKTEFRLRYLTADAPDSAKRMSTPNGRYVWNETLHGWVFSSSRSLGWDLDYHNPVVLNEMIFSMCRWANLGVCGFHLARLPLIWKTAGTTCEDLPQVHTILRIIRLSLESVAPSLVLSSEAGLAMSTYFGTRAKPECHVMDDRDLSANLFAALASQDARLLRWRTEDLLALPSHCVFTFSLGKTEPLRWNLNTADEQSIGVDPAKHHSFLYQFFGGVFPRSYARGRLCGYDPVSKMAMDCGTPASLCGIEAALEEGQGIALAKAIQRYLLLEATLSAMRGLPAIESGDEIARLNDYTKGEGDVRSLLLGPFNWGDAEKRNDRRTVAGRIFSALTDIRLKRKANNCFGPGATVSTWNAQNDHVLALRRVGDGKVLLCLSNFSDAPQKVRFAYFIGMYRDLFSAKMVSPGWGFTMQPLEYLWLEATETSSIMDARETVG